MDYFVYPNEPDLNKLNEILQPYIGTKYSEFECPEGYYIDEHDLSERFWTQTHGLKRDRITVTFKNDIIVKIIAG